MKIVIQEVDYKSACRKAHFNCRTSIQACTKYESYILMQLRTTCGGFPNPNEWGLISEFIADLANAIINNSECNPEELHSSLQHKVPKDKLLYDDIPFTPALPMVMDHPLEHYGKCDIYIDDSTVIVLDKEDN